MPRSGSGEDMGLGHLSDADLVFKRKYRWTLEIRGLCVGDIPPFYVKTAARPSLTIDETEINFLHGKTWIPGKGTWESLNVTYYDVKNNPNLSTLYSWLATVYNFTDPIGIHQASTIRGYAGLGILKMFDGCGTVLEEWNLHNMWPQAVNWGDLDYASSEECVIDITMRYAFAESRPTQCAAPIDPCCSGCEPPRTASALAVLLNGFATSRSFTLPPNRLTGYTYALPVGGPPFLTP
jgi:hypothetical protein